jgi:hypothetical protein
MVTTATRQTNREAERQIHRCQQYGVGSCDGRGWHRYTYHPGGTMWAEELRPKYATKREALEAVREAAANAA